MKRKISSFLLPAAAVIILFILWEISISIFAIPAWKLSRPTEIAMALFRDYKEILPAVFYTYTNVIIGFVLAMTVGLSLGSFINGNKLAGVTLTPYVNLLCTIPLITIVPLLMLWFGIGRPIIILTIVIQSFPIMNFNCCVAFANVDPLRLELMDSFKVGKLKRLYYCILPDAIPGVFTGIKLSAILSILSSITAEMTGGNQGLGAQINVFVAFLKMPQAMACIFYIALLGLVLYYSISHIEARIMKTRNNEGEQAS
ncbi:MAG: ABC transporter permease [Clostridiales Family XIII bacterium]|jgi:NitT/TauT family transport system permease protein|nr:ABC transporter permease [Clostridiales Family XIII bacterium]